MLNQPADSDNVGGRHEGYTSREDAERAVAIFKREQAAAGEQWRAKVAATFEPEGSHAETVSKGNLHRVADGGRELSGEIARLFGQRIVIIETEGADAPRFNGFVNDSPKLAEYIFLHKNSNRPHLLTVGHEIWHHLHISAPGLAKLVKGELQSEIRNWDRLRDSKPDYRDHQIFEYKSNLSRVVL